MTFNSDVYQVTASQRDELKKNHPIQYGDLLELVIAGRIVIVNDAEVTP
jgi:hypothetical protein